MSSQTPVVIARLSPKDKQARAEVGDPKKKIGGTTRMNQNLTSMQLLTFLQNGSENALKNELGTLRYVFATNRDDKDESIYIVEQ